MPDEVAHSTDLVSITGTGNKNLYLLGNLYREPFDAESVLSAVVGLEHRPEVKWTTIYTSETWCTAMDQSGDALFVVDLEGALHRYRDGAWQVVDLECPDGSNSVWAATDDEAFAVGMRGERVRVTGSRVEVTEDLAGRRLNAIHGCSESGIFAVGDGGLVHRFYGGRWRELDCPTDANLLAVLCCSETRVYLAGAEGTLLRWVGTGFEELEGSGTAITDLAMYRNRVYAATGRGGVQVLRDDRLEACKDLHVYRMRTIDDRLYCIGRRLVAQFNGEEWWGGNLTL